MMVHQLVNYKCNSLNAFFEKLFIVLLSYVVESE